MEAEAVAMENAFVEGKILWLAQIILESTSNGKLAEWIRHAGLGEGMEKLTSEIERIETVVAAAKGRATRNKPLARSLARLKELLYDADDLVDDLDYFRLQEQVEGGGSTIACVNDPEDTDGDGGGAEQVEGSRGNPDLQSKKRANESKLWEHFYPKKDASGKFAKCKYCPAGKGVIRCGGTTGTRGLKTHFESKKCHRKLQAHNKPPNPASAIDAAPNDITDATQDLFRGKRMRINEASTQNAASNTCSWDKAKISKNIRDIVSELQGLREKVRDSLMDSVACSDQCQSNNIDTQIRTSSFAPRKVYGRDVEKEYIIRVITAAECDSITVLPIVGIVGVGKTAVAQLVYNDPAVKSEFQRIWVWVSDSFDEVRLTREILDVVSLESHEGSLPNKESHGRIGNYSKLQEILKEHMGQRSRRFLLVLDDVSDRMDNKRWKQLLAPLESSDKKGNVIVITTRNLSVARRLGTVEPRKLGALENEAFWLLFKACAFGDDNYEGHPSLAIIGRQIAAKLKGNPFAAENAGELLNEHLTIDHWSSILNSEGWKSMRFNKSIMHALKLSYDNLPYNVQQCLLYCSIFPDNYEFLAEDLIFTWISQGFMRHINSSKTPEQIGRDFLNCLVDLCFFKHVERKDSTIGNQLCYVMCGIVHDFARLISGTECAAIHCMEYKEMLPTIRHLSILTDSAYCTKDQHGNPSCKREFEEKLRGVVTSATKLRTLVLIGKYDSVFFQSFADIFQMATYLRMLRISATYTDFNSFLSKLVNSAHLRYLKLDKEKGSIEDLHMSLRKFYHLQVLDVGHATKINDMSGLVSMRHLVVKKGTHFMNPNSICLEMTQLESMNELVHLSVHQLQNANRAEVCGARLRDKKHLENLHLSWKDALSQDGYDRGISSENHSNSSPEDYGNTSSENHSNSSTEDYGNTSAENHSNSSPEDYRKTSSENYSNSSPEDYGNTSSQRYTDTEPEEENWPINGANNILTSEQFIDTAKEVLAGLEPHRNLKHLRISGYSDANSPNWFSRIVLYTCLQTLHLEDCGEWQTLPSLERLPFLTKLKLRNMSKVTQVSIPPLEELVLIKMQNLERCSCNSTKDLNSSLRVLMIKRCQVLKAFPPFESCKKFRTERNSWLSGLSMLTVHDCPQLVVSNPLPPSSSGCKISIKRVSTLPTMKGSLNGELIIGSVVYDKPPFIDEDSDELRKLDEKILAFHNLRVLTHLKIAGCKNLSFVSLEGFKQLINLTSLEILNCVGFFSSDVLPEHAHEDMENAHFNAFPTLKHLSFSTYGYGVNRISGKWLSVMLQHAPVLEELYLKKCGEISELSILEGNESCLSNHNSSPRASSLGNPNAASTSSTREGTVHIPLNLVSSLKKITISLCGGLTFLEKNASFSAFTSLEELVMEYCPELISSFEPKDENSDHATVSVNCLKKLRIISSDDDLECLKLESYTNLEELTIHDLKSLTTVEGLQSLRGLKYLKVTCCRRLPPFPECMSGKVTELFPRLEGLCIDDMSFLTTSFCMHLISLQHLKFEGVFNNATGEQNRALQLVTSLKDLHFSHCSGLVDLPVCLHSLSSLKRLGIIYCRRIVRLPEKGLPPSLEELEISNCSEQLTSVSRLLATSMLKVKINGHYVN